MCSSRYKSAYEGVVTCARADEHEMHLSEWPPGPRALQWYDEHALPET